MARPQKSGLDYFPLDVDIDQDDKIAIIEAEHGILGFGVIIKLFMKIYDNGYYYEWNEKERILFAKRIGKEIKKINPIVADSVRWKLFSEKLYKKYNILTSRAIQIRYLEAAKRRKEVELIKEYLLLKNDEINAYNNLVIVNINPINVDINPHSSIDNADISTQSKVDDIKVNDIYKKITCQHLSMTEVEYKKLVDKYGKTAVDEKLEYAENYKNLKKYVSLYLTINHWLKKDFENTEYGISDIKR